MADLGLQGAIRGKSVWTTMTDKAAPCPLDHVNRQFHVPAPNLLWLSDLTYVSTWSSYVYVAFVIDAYARRIVGWRVSRTALANFVLEPLAQAVHERRTVPRAELVHHSDRGSQYVSIRYTERLAEARVCTMRGSKNNYHTRTKQPKKLARQFSSKTRAVLTPSSAAITPMRSPCLPAHGRYN